MKKLILILTIISTVLISSCQEKMKKYHWLPSENAPSNYPAEIYSGYFYYGDKSNIYIPNRRMIDFGWGEPGSVDIVGDEMKEAPHKLEITWVSYTENKNYTGTFDLDVKKIDSLFATGYPDDNTDSIGKFSTISVGLAPRGRVVVWMSGDRSKQVEVGSYQAKETGPLNWSIVYPNMKGTMQEYINLELAKFPAEIQQQIKDKKIPFGYWDSLRKRYNWKPVTQSSALVNRIDIDYFNKEHDFKFGEGLKHTTYALSAVPEAISIYWHDKYKRYLRTDIFFDEKEAFQIFAQIQDGQKADLITSINSDSSDVRIGLKINDMVIPFKNINEQTFLK